MHWNQTCLERKRKNKSFCRSLIEYEIAFLTINISLSNSFTSAHNFKRVIMGSAQKGKINLKLSTNLSSFWHFHEKVT
jgi:hypothetical protein